MKIKHLHTRMKQCLELAKLSTCKRRQFGAMILDPDSLTIISDGYNGTARGGPLQCYNDTICIRTHNNIKSGTQTELGCIHAEQNAILNACRVGAKTLNTIMILNGTPCLQCSKMIHHAGIKQIYCLIGQYPEEASGIDYLRKYKVDIHYVQPNTLYL